MNRKNIFAMLLGAVIVCLNIIVGSSILLAQTKELAVDNKDQKQEVDAIKCWWRSDKSSVRVGENFLVILTCQVVETEDNKVVPDENLLEPSVISLAPFGVIEGVKYPSIYKENFRFFQYQYLLNIVEEDYFGKDVLIPSVDISYKVEKKTTQLESINTKEKIYEMPELTIKVQSLVYKNANDIRDTGNETFGEMQNRRFKSNLAFVLSTFLFAVPLLAMSVYAVRSFRQFRNKRCDATLFSVSKLLAQVFKELKKVKQTRRSSDWDGELIGRVVIVFRIAGAIGLVRNVSQLSVVSEAKGLEGQLKLQKGWFRPTKVLVFSNLTPETMRKGIAGSLNRKWSEDFLKVFETFNYARYSVKSIDVKELDGALSVGIELIQKLRHHDFEEEDKIKILGFEGMV